LSVDPPSTLLFGAIAAAMTLAVFAWVLRPLLGRRPRTPRADADAASPNVGDMPRLQPRSPSRRIGAAVALLSAALAAGLYALLGDVRAVDGRHTLDAQTALEIVPAGMLREDLTAHLARNPRDGRSWILLARMDLSEDRFAQAADAFARALAADPRVGKDPGIWCEYADALGMAQGGTLAGRPRELVLQALALDPAHPKALELAGSAAYEAREYGAAARHWRGLLAQLPPASAERRDLDAAIARADLLAVSVVR
jgi:cytochrome c-type biogenesis protein CcmH